MKIFILDFFRLIKKLEEKQYRTRKTKLIKINKMAENEKNGIKLPGIEISYPNTTIGLLSILTISMLIVFILLTILVWATPKNINEVTKFTQTIQKTEISRYRYSVDGKPEKLTERTQIQFMTPSRAIVTGKQIGRAHV